MQGTCTSYIDLTSGYANRQCFSAYLNLSDLPMSMTHYIRSGEVRVDEIYLERVLYFHLVTNANMIGLMIQSWNQIMTLEPWMKPHNPVTQLA